MKTKKLFSGTYLFIGNNFSIELNNDNKFWAVDIYSSENKGIEKLKSEVIDFQFSTKKEIVSALQNLDNNLTKPTFEQN